MSPWLVARHPLDRAVAALLTVILGPVVAVLGALIRRGSPGPVLIRLPRIGREGRELALLKLRTMRSVGSRGGAGGAHLTAGPRDRRITPLGRWLRRWRLDELPQLVHVVGGSMALIGPRPEAPAYVDSDDARWRTVLLARPGITGASQIVFHDWEERMLDQSSRPSAAARDVVYRQRILPLKLAVDAWYTTSASPLLDLVVLAGTLERFLGRRTVTSTHRWVARRVPGVDEVVAALRDPRLGGRVAGSARERAMDD